MTKPWDVAHPKRYTVISKPALYCASDNGCLARGGTSSTLRLLRAFIKELRVAISGQYECVVRTLIVDIGLVGGLQPYDEAGSR
jgi:hypothetical protein